MRWKLQWIVVGAAVIAATAGVAVAQATDADQSFETQGWVVPSPEQDPGYGIDVDVIGELPDDEAMNCIRHIPDYSSQREAEQAVEEALASGQPLVDCSEVPPPPPEPESWQRGERLSDEVTP